MQQRSAMMAVIASLSVAIGTALSVPLMSADAPAVSAAAPAAAIWYDTAEGRQIGVWGAPGAYSWTIDHNGRGTLTLVTRTVDDYRPTRSRFTLSAEQHAAFADLLRRFTDGPQDQSLCMTDQTQDIVQWRGSAGGDGLFNFDHGCRSEANEARLALMTQAVDILRTAAVRRAPGA